MLTYVGQGGSALFALLLPEWWEGIGTSFALISEKEDNTCQPSMRGGDREGLFGAFGGTVHRIRGW